MSHPMINTVVASTTQDARADVIVGWADAGALVVGSRVGPCGLTWDVRP